TGTTIPLDKHNQIFDKFYRLNDARSTNTGGAGLGLAIAKEIVTLHEGQIDMQSENGKTVFSVKLPLISQGGHHG
ncbi:ATP-binding protein, partial [Paenibacillus riograndensis]